MSVTLQGVTKGAISSGGSVLADMGMRPETNPTKAYHIASYPNCKVFSLMQVFVNSKLHHDARMINRIDRRHPRRVRISIGYSCCCVRSEINRKVIQPSEVCRCQCKGQRTSRMGPTQYRANTEQLAVLLVVVLQSYKVRNSDGL